MFNALSKAQIAVVLGFIILIVLLFIAKTKAPQKEESAAIFANTDVSIDSYINEAKAALNAEQKASISELESAFDHASSNQKIAFCDSLTKKWDLFQKPVAAAYFSEKKAMIESSSENWKQAGNRYFAATKFIQPNSRSSIFQAAINCFTKAIEKDANNIDAKISLAACYVEGTNDPMKGINLLKEVEKIDSNNINLQLNFAAFSEKSGQLEKAIVRYNKVLTIDSNYIEAYLHLADAYENQGKKNEAIKSLEKYAGLVNDITIKTEVKNYINKLKNN